MPGPWGSIRAFSADGTPWTLVESGAIFTITCFHSPQTPSQLVTGQVLCLFGILGIEAGRVLEWFAGRTSSGPAYSDCWLLVGVSALICLLGAGECICAEANI